MKVMYPEFEPYKQGLLEVGDGHQINWELAQARPDGEVVVVDNAGHSSGELWMADAIVAGIDRFRELV